MDPDRPNPLNISLIIQKIVELLDIKTLKRCRLVNKLWESEANRFLDIKKHPLIISKTFDLETSNYQPSNFIIIPANIGLGYYWIIKKAIQQLNAWNIQYLELQNPGWTLAQLEEIIADLPKVEQLTLSEDFVLSKVEKSSTRYASPKLQSLELNLKDESLQNLANIEFVFELYKIVPNLQKVKCWTGLFPDPVCPHTTIFSNLLFRSIVESVNLSHCRNISYLDINLDLRNDDIDLLIRASLPLKTLHLPLDIMISSVKVDNLLSSLKPTLKRLKLTHRNCIRSSPLLENLVNLEYLAINGYDQELKKDPRSYSNDQSVFYIFNMVPLTMFPSFLDNFQFHLTQLEEIRMNNVYFITEDIYNFKTLFPNLKKINVSFLDDFMLRSVFQNFPDLESLTVQDGQFSDSGLTGIALDVQEILQNGVTNNLGCERLREFPNISSLKNLQTLELASPKVTDFGVINGIALCKSVQELILNLPQIKDPSLRIIIKNLNLDILSIKSGTFSKAIIEEAVVKMQGGAFSLFLLNKMKS